MFSLKKGTTVLFASLIFASLTSPVFANDLSTTLATNPSEISLVNSSVPLQFDDKVPDNLFSSISLQYTKNIEGNQTYTITDKNQLKQIATERGLSEVPERIEYEYHPNARTTSSLFDKSSDFSVNADRVYWAEVSDLGVGWYNASKPYNTFYIDGPDKFVYTQSITQNTTWDKSFGMQYSVLKGQIGFGSGEQRTVTFTSSTPVKENQTLTAKLYVTYHKVFYSVYHGIQYDNTSGKCLGTGYAMEPAGTMIEKTFHSRN